MSTVQAAIRECHRLRKHLKNLQSEIDLGPRVAKAQLARLGQEEQAHKTAHETIKKLKLKQREDEGTLKQVETLLDKLHARSMTVTTMKEMDATRSEIAQATAKKEALEDAILSAMTEVEERTAKTPEVDKRWADAQAEYRQQQEEGKARLARLHEEVGLSKEALAKVEATLPPKVKPTYDGLVKAFGPDAMAVVENRVCLGCRTSLTEQKMIDLRAGAFTLCSNCGKMLHTAE